MQDPARSRWTGRRAGLGSKMSTQRPASRTTPATEIDRPGLRLLTAPLMSIVWLTWAWLRLCGGSPRTAADRVATNSLLPDSHNDTLAWLDSRSASPPLGDTAATNTCCWGPPGRAGVRRPSARGTHRSSLRHDSLLPVRARLHPTLPIAPAGQDRWAERHDGKRNLYFQHAA